MTIRHKSMVFKTISVNLYKMDICSIYMHVNTYLTDVKVEKTIGEFP